MKRSEKIKLSQEAEKQAKELDNRSAEDRDEARREWAQVRKAAREAFIAGGDWKAVLDGYKDRAGFYTAEERERMCRAYTDELVMHGLR